MRYHYNLVCPDDEPIIRDMPVYDAALLANGELLMKGTSDPDAGADQGIALVTAVTGSAAEAVNCVGILQDARWNVNVQGVYSQNVAPSNVPATNALGPKYGKVIINPGAVYLAEYDQADAIAITSTAGTTLTVAALQDDIDGSFVYFVGGTTGVTGSLRHLDSGAAGAAVMDSALTVNGTAADSIIRTLRPLSATSNLNAAATGLSTTAAINSGISLRVVDNYVQADNIPFVPLRKATHKGLNNLQKAKLFADVVSINHCLTGHV
jgi:hypothetical protein